MGAVRKLAEYEFLKTILIPDTPVYGPLQSRRFGQSLGINLLGSDEKICSFNCVYCELGDTKIRMRDVKKNLPFIQPEELDLSLRNRLKELYDQNISIDSITISGNGEPTLHPRYPEMIEIIVTAKADIFPETPVRLLTNGSMLDQRKIAQASNRLDDVVVKFDAGNDRVLSEINSPSVRQSTNKTLSGMRNLDRLSLQCMFVSGSVDNTTPSHIEEWIEAIALTQAHTIYLYSLDRVPRSPGLQKVSEAKLTLIKRELQKNVDAKIIIIP